MTYGLRNPSVTALVDLDCEAGHEEPEPLWQRMHGFLASRMELTQHHRQPRPGESRRSSRPGQARPVEAMVLMPLT